MDSVLADQLKLFAEQILTFSFSSSVDGVKSVFRKKESGDEFYNSKIETGNFFLTKLLTETQMLHENIKSGGKYYNDYKDNYFETAI